MTNFNVAALNSIEKTNSKLVSSSSDVSKTQKSESVFQNDTQNDAVEVEMNLNGNFFGAEAISDFEQNNVQKNEPDIQNLKDLASKAQKKFNNSLTIVNQKATMEAYNDWGQGVVDSTSVSRDDILLIINKLEYVVKHNTSAAAKVILDRKDTGTKAILEKLYAKLKDMDAKKEEAPVQPKDEPKPEAKVEDKVEPKPEPKVDDKVEPKPETKVEVKIEIEHKYEKVEPEKLDPVEPKDVKPETDTKTDKAEPKYEKVEPEKLNPVDDIKNEPNVQPKDDKVFEEVKLDKLPPADSYDKSNVQPKDNRVWEEVKLDDLPPLDSYVKPDVQPKDNRVWEKVELDDLPPLDSYVKPKTDTKTDKVEPKYEKVEPEKLDPVEPKDVKPETDTKTDKVEPKYEKVEPEKLDPVEPKDVKPETDTKTDKAEPKYDKVEPEKLNPVDDNTDDGEIKLYHGKGSLKEIAERAKYNHQIKEWTESQTIYLQLGEIDRYNELQRKIDENKVKINELTKQIETNAKSREEAARLNEEALKNRK